MSAIDSFGFGAGGTGEVLNENIDLEFLVLWPLVDQHSGQWLFSVPDLPAIHNIPERAFLAGFAFSDPCRQQRHGDLDW